MSAIITDLFRIHNAQQFVEALSEPTTSTPAEEAAAEAGTQRTRLYFFIGRPQEWKAYLELYAINNTFQVGEVVYQGTSYPGGASVYGTVEKVFPNSVLLSGVNGTLGQNSNFVAGTTVTGNASGATGKAGVWRTGSENVPTSPFDSQEEKFEIYDDMISLKRVKKDDLTFVVKRYNFGANTVYDMYKPDYSSSKTAATGATSLFASTFYVMNSNYEVFKCLYNGQTPTDPNGVVSVTEPTKVQSISGIFIEPEDAGNPGFRTDGKRPYIWKYMYTIPTDSVLKFLSTDFLPIIEEAAVTSAAVNGAIDTILITDSGTNYDAGTYYTPIKGDGSAGIAKLVVDSGAIAEASVQAAGTNYTYASINLGDVYSDTGLTTPSNIDANSDATGGALEVIIPPQGGHGADPVEELGGKRVMINTRLTYDEGEGDFPTDNDFRRIGLLRDPYNYGTTDFATADNLSATGALKVQSPSGDFFVDEEISQTYTSGGSSVTAKGTVVSWKGTVDGVTYNIVKYFQSPDRHTHNGVVYPFDNGSDAISGAGSLSTATVNSTYNTPGGQTDGGVVFSNGVANAEIAKNSGDIIYIENRRAISRASDQIEDIKLVVEF